MIKIENLNFNYNDNQLLDNINIVIEDGDYIAIVGSNGSGKSTLIKCILGINKVDNSVVFIDGVDINKYKNFKSIGYVQQIKATGCEVSITCMEYLRLISNDKEKLDGIIKQLNMEKFINSSINILSGGQKQTFNIAKALLHDIKYLILDEPNTGLDFSARQSLYETLAKLNKDGITIIIISHHIDEISCKINKIYSMETNLVSEVNYDGCEYC